MSKKDQFLKNYKLEGEQLKVYTYPHRVLTFKAKKVTSFNNKLVTLVKNMLYTMYVSPGIGLAASQIGENISLFVVDEKYRRKKVILEDGSEDYELDDFCPYVFINPEITQMEEEITCQEGCLSIPGVYEDVTRSKHITIEYFDLNGDKRAMEASDMLAVCIQHEFDHLNGMVFLDRLGPIKKNMIKRKLIKKKRKKKKKSI